MSGFWVFVCGPSGAGKDSVIGWARQQLAHDPTIVFAQRLMTRPVASGADHHGMLPVQFQQLQDTGGLAWHWQAHGFYYGVAARYARQVGWGRLVVVNGSREHVVSLQGNAQVRVAQIVADAKGIASRLVQRGRDAPEAIASRLARNTRLEPVEADLTIVNDGELRAAGTQLAAYLASLKPRPCESAPRSRR